MKISLLKKLMRFAKILAVSLVFTLVFFSPVALAATGSSTDSMDQLKSIPIKSIPINGGQFKVNPVKPVQH